MGALTIKKESFKFRPWRSNHDAIINTFTVLPFKANAINESNTRSAIRPTSNWIANRSRDALKTEAFAISVKGLISHPFVHTKTQFGFYFSL